MFIYYMERNKVKNRLLLDVQMPLKIIVMES